ncbi:MAG TPA: gas vesicle protein GvpJ [Ktedonobacteraceae bacterium]|jgi:hypothetical protein
MNNEQTTNDYPGIENRHVTLLELLDRIIDKGVVAKGEILLSVADIDLIYLNLGLVLSSVKTIVNAAGTDERRQIKRSSQQTALQQEFWGEPRSEPYPDAANEENELPPLLQEQNSARADDGKTLARALPSSAPRSQHRRSTRKKTTKKATIDQDNVERGLIKLVLTLVDLIRQLMEKQAIRRIEDEQLDVSEIEKMGNAFSLLDEKMTQLKKMFDLTDEDLNLDLGPLGELK